MLTCFEEQHGKAKGNERTERSVELVIARGNATVVFEMMEQPLNLVASAIELLVVTPGFLRVRFGRHDGDTSLFAKSGTSLVVGIAFVHHDASVAFKGDFLQQLAAFGRVIGIAGAQRKCDPRMGSGGKQMDLRCQSAS